MRVLIVEDDAQVAKVISIAMVEESWEPEIAVTGQEGLDLALNHSFDVIILDVMLPDMSGIQVIRKLREAALMSPVLFLTALDSVEQRVKGLDAGADDYLTKPFEVAELQARVRALSRRKGSIMNEDVIEYGRLSIDIQAHDGYVDHQPLQLTVKEYELLEYLLRHAERILPREQIFVGVWGFSADAASAIVDVYVHYLRRKLAAHDGDKYIRTIRGVGYMLKE